MIGAGFWWLFYAGTLKLLTYVRSIEIFGEILSEKLYSMTFFSLTGFLALSNVITALSSFYMSNDLPFLLTKPIRIGDIIRVKTFDTVLNSSWMVLSFITPVFIAYGTSYNAPAVYYPSVFAGIIIFILITSGAGITVAHILARLFPAGRSREVLLGLGLVFFIALYFIVKSIVPSGISTPEEILQAFVNFRSESPFLPGYWITRATLPMLKKSGPDLFYMLLLLSNGAFFMLVASMTGKRLYRANLEKLGSTGKGGGERILKGYYPAGNTAMLYKDARIFFRDTGQWSQIFIIGALLVIYVFNFRSVPVASLSGLSPYIIEMMVTINMVMAGLVLSAAAARFLYTAVSLEGMAFWSIRTAPVRMDRFLWSKFLYNSAPLTFLIILIIYLADSALRAGPLLICVSLGTTLMLSLAICGLGVGLGAIYPKFRYENIASVSMSIGGMVFMVLAFSLVLSTLSLEAWVFYLVRLKGALGSTGSLADKLQVFACVAMVPAINAVALYWPMRLGIRSLEREIY